MTTIAESLREIHRLRRHATELQKNIESIPKKKEILRAGVEFKEKQLADAQDHIKRLKVRAHEDDVTLRSVSEQIAKHQKQLTEIISKREFDALHHEIDHDKQKKDELEDRILQTLTEIDEWEAKIPGREKEVGDAKKELADFERESESKREDLKKELEKTRSQLEDAESRLPAGEFRTNYQRLVDHRGDEAFASVRNKTCQDCYTAVTPQTYSELLKGEFVLCKACGRILYFADSEQ